MTVGVPGVGFGGIFYLIGALFMPVREVARTARGESSAERWVVVATQWSLAAGILVALWGTGWVLGHLLSPALLARTGAAAGRAAFAPHNVVKVSVFVASLGMLAILIAAVRVTHLVLRLRGGIPVQQLTPMPAAKHPLPDSLRHPEAQYLETGTDG